MAIVKNFRIKFIDWSLTLEQSVTLTFKKFLSSLKDCVYCRVDKAEVEPIAC